MRRLRYDSREQVPAFLTVRVVVGRRFGCVKHLQARRSQCPSRAGR